MCLVYNYKYRGGGAMAAHQVHTLKTEFESHVRNQYAGMAESADALA